MRSPALTDRLFERGCLCIGNLRSSRIALTKKDSGRSITCSVEGFPYVVLWSAPTKPLLFVCIEPWVSLPGEEGEETNWQTKACAACSRTKPMWWELRLSFDCALGKHRTAWWVHFARSFVCRDAAILHKTDKQTQTF